MQNNKPLSHNFILSIEILSVIIVIALAISAIKLLTEAGGVVTPSHLMGVVDLILVCIGILGIRSYLRKQRTR